MRLYIGLIHYIDAVFVAEGIPHRVIRIVGCSYCIDIQLFHDSYVLEHLFIRYHVSAIRAHFVTVNALEQDCLTIDKQLAVLYLDRTEAEFH